MKTVNYELDCLKSSNNSQRALTFCRQIAIRRISCVTALGVTRHRAAAAAAAAAAGPCSYIITASTSAARYSSLMSTQLTETDVVNNRLN